MCAQALTERPLRVLIDGRKLGQGGIGEYVNNLIDGLLRVNIAAGAECVSLGVIAAPEVAAKYAWRRQVELIADLTPSYSFGEYFLLAKKLPLDAFELFHAPHYTLPFGIDIPCVVTLHDLIHVQCPQRWYYPYVASALIRSAVRRATRVVAVSEATAQGLCELMPGMGLRQKIRVLPNALSAALVSHVPNERAVLEKYQLRRPFLFSVVSQDKPHKGVADLEAAFGMFTQTAEGRGASLVIAGQGTKSGERNGVRYLGNVPDSDLFDLYAAATALVVPSLAEGFFLPALYAKAFGTRVVARPIAPLREILESHDVFASDMSVPSLAQAMRRVLSCAAPSNAQLQLLRSRFDLTQLGWEMLKVYLDTSQRVAPQLASLLATTPSKRPLAMEAA